MRTCNTRKLVCTGIAIAATLSVIGTGFCLWVLIPEDKIPYDKASLNVQIAEDADVGTFDMRSLSTDNGTLDLVQKGYTFPRMLVFEEGNGHEEDLTAGLSFYKLISNDTPTPGNPIYKDQPYFADETLITFYRDVKPTFADLKAQQMRLALRMKIKITPELAKFITIQDSFKAEVEQVVDPGQEEPSFIYTYDYTKEITDIPKKVHGSDLIGQSIQTSPSNYINTAKDYEVWNYRMKFSKIFRYKDISMKPTSITIYNKLVKDILSNGREVLSFKLLANYVPYDGTYEYNI